MATYKQVLNKITKAIKSCETLEQLQNTHRWAHSILNNRHQFTKRNNNGDHLKIAESFGENEAIMVVLYNLIVQRVEELGLEEVAYGEAFIQREM